MECNLPFQYNFIFQLYQSVEPPSSTLEVEGGGGAIDICPRGLFWRKFNAEQLYLKVFWLRCIFLAALSPKWKVFCYVYLNFCYKDGGLTYRLYLVALI